MILRLYRVFDTKAETGIGPLLMEPRDAPAIRTFTDALKDAQSLGRHPEDYELLYLGDMNEHCAITIPNECPTLVLAGTLWRSMQQQPEAK